MGRHMGYVIKPPKATQSDYFSHKMIVCSKHATTHVVVVHPMLRPDTINNLETLVVKIRKLPSLPKADGPGLAIVKKSTANCGIAHPSHERRVAMPQVSQARGSCSGLPNS